MLYLKTLIQCIGPKDLDLCHAVAIAMALIGSDLEQGSPVICHANVEKLSRLAERIREAAKREGVTYTVPRSPKFVRPSAENEEKTEKVLQRIRYNSLGYIVEAMQYACAERAYEAGRESIGLK